MLGAPSALSFRHSIVSEPGGELWEDHAMRTSAASGAASWVVPAIAVAELVSLAAPIPLERSLSVYSPFFVSGRPID
jgi:hypothetical protein